MIGLALIIVGLVLAVFNGLALLNASEDDDET